LVSGGLAERREVRGRHDGPHHAQRRLGRAAFRDPRRRARIRPVGDELRDGSAGHRGPARRPRRRAGGDLGARRRYRRRRAPPVRGRRMIDRTLPRLAWTIWIVGVVVMVGAMTFRFTLHEPFQPADLTEPLAFASIGVVGLIVALHQPRNPIGWIYLAVWVGAAGSFALLQEYAYWVETSHPTAPGEPIAVWLGNWTWVPIFTLLLTYPFLLFPDGHLPSPRWRPVAWGIAI